MPNRTFTTGWRRIKPVRPYKTLADFRRFNNWLGQPDDKWPCLACRARGLELRRNGPAVPGRRQQRPSHRHLLCLRRHARGPKEACVKAYKEAIRKFHQEAHEYKALVQRRKEAVIKLTKEELQALKELGL